MCVTSRVKDGRNFRKCSYPRKLFKGYDDDDEQSTRRMLGEYHYSNEGPALQFFKTQVNLFCLAMLLLLPISCLTNIRDLQTHLSIA